MTISAEALLGCLVFVLFSVLWIYFRGLSPTGFSAQANLVAFLSASIAGVAVYVNAK